MKRVSRAPLRGAAKRNAAKTHCPHGHPYSPANTYEWNGKRYCKACMRDKAYHVGTEV